MSVPSAQFAEKNGFEAVWQAESRLVRDAIKDLRSAERAIVICTHNLAEAEELADNIAIKVPLTWDGLKACRVLSGEGRMVNVTLCFSANQALLAAKAGAR